MLSGVEASVRVAQLSISLLCIASLKAHECTNDGSEAWRGAWTAAYIDFAIKDEIEICPGSGGGGSLT